MSTTEHWFLIGTIVVITFDFIFTSQQLDFLIRKPCIQ